MYALHAKPIIEEYTAYTGQECTLGSFIVTVLLYTNNSRTGSYARGFKFSSNTYGYLITNLGGIKCYSPDHGVTWYNSIDEMKTQRAGKVKLSSTCSKEFAFDSIQQINKSYDNNYSWKA